MAQSIQGLHGHLFLTDDTNDVHAQISGRFDISDGERSAIRRAHEERATHWDYRHVICPAKESALRHLMPHGYGYETHGPCLARRLGGGFYEPDIIAHGFSKLDTHWTDVGALDYLTAVLARFQRSPSLPATVVDVGLRMGDLGVKLGLAAETVATVRCVNPTVTVIEESTIVNEGYHRIQRSAASGRALVLHDSYAHNLFEILGEMYGETIFVHSPHLDLTAANAIQPDVIWFFQAERFMPRILSNDVTWAWRQDSPAWQGMTVPAAKTGLPVPP